MRSERGSVYFTPNGWRAQVTVGGQRRSLGYHDTEDGAWDVIAAYLEQAGDTGGQTLLGYGEMWLERRETEGRVRSVNKERSVWRAHVAEAPFVGMPLHRIERRHVAQWARELLSKEALDAITVGSGKSRRVVHRKTGRRISRQVAVHALRVLRSCLREAADEGLIPSNPALDVRVPKTAPRDPAWTFLGAGEIDQVLGCEKIEQSLRDIYAVAIYTGLRKSELWRLQWDHVELQTDRPRLLVRGAAKSDSAIREVPLLPPAAEALRRTRDRGGVRRMSGLVWPSNTGRVRGETDDAKWADRRTRRKGEITLWTGNKTAAGITRPVRFHDLRHTCASHLVMGSWLGRPLSLLEVKEWMGHSDVGVTQRYAHLAPDSIHGAALTFRGETRSHQNRTTRDREEEG